MKTAILVATVTIFYILVARIVDYCETKTTSCKHIARCGFYKCDGGLTLIL